MSTETKKPGNPPAFPAIAGLAGELGSYLQEGMTLRDYFAAKAMCSLVPSYSASMVRVDSEVCAEIVAASYILADAMLEERSKKP